MRKNDQNNNILVDALDGSGITDYKRLMNEFGIEPFSNVKSLIPKNKLHPFITRGIMFGHTDINSILEAIKENKKFICMTGIKPTGSYHIGSLCTVQEIIYFQQMGAKVYFCIADMEAYITNKQPFNTSKEIAIDNIADVLALGLDISKEKAFIYKQSTNEEILRMGLVFSSSITYSTIRAIYGEKANIGYYNSSFIQSADILLPQILEGPMPTVTPIGADQAPHARLTRDIAKKEKFQKQFKFKIPSFTFHFLLEGIDGSPKMSKKIPMSVFSFNDDFKTEIKPKIKNALTGGRDTADEQRRLGGRPDKCRIFDLFKFMFESKDKDLIERNSSCQNGTLLCGPCKQDLIIAIKEYQDQHNNKKDLLHSTAKDIVNSLN